MRGRLSLALLLLALAAAAARAQQFTHEWLWVSPEGEEFGVLMPEENFRIRRLLNLGDVRVLTPASYEVAHRGVLFSVLSFPKSAAGAPATLGELAEGFARALEVNRTRAESQFRFEKDLSLEGRAGKQFAVKVGDAQGSARVYEAAAHFYVVMTLGDPNDPGAAARFQDSFSFDRGGQTRVPARETVAATAEPKKAPAPLWLVAGSSTALGSRGPEPGAERRTLAPVSGGVLNGKALRKHAPTYPAIAKAARASGAVVVKITVDEEGYVIASNAVSGHPLLQPAAARAVRWWRFTPTLLEGRPVKLSGNISINFTLR